MTSAEWLHFRRARPLPGFGLQPMSVVLSTNEVRERYQSGLDCLRKGFESDGAGAALTAGRSRLVDEVIDNCYHQLIEQETIPPNCVAIVALGGYGRQTLLPHSDVDLLFLFKDLQHETAYKDALSRIYLDLWDLKIRASATARTVSECGNLDPQNPEFTVSLLDSRLLLGDDGLFHSVRRKVLPGLLRKSGAELIELVSTSARARHGKYAHTIYHLEPNVKEGPGGLRDYNLACWLALVGTFRRTGVWPNQESLFEPQLHRELMTAFDFFVSVRCFLHLGHGRDDNHLSWESQDAAAVKGIGITESRMEPARWMREYFRNARAIHGAAIQLLESSAHKRTSLVARLKTWRSGDRDSDLSVVNGMVSLSPGCSLTHCDDVFRIFERLAHQPLRLTIEAQRSLMAVAACFTGPEVRSSFWPHLRNILVARQAGNALRAMRDCGLLDALIPEFKLIDALVIRDFFHRYTVDEHSLLTIETLHRLRDRADERSTRFADILDELERPELLFLSLLLHDIGKGKEGESHVTTSISVAQQVLQRLRLEQRDQEMVLFLIQSHLEMSASMRRDIFDSKVINTLADKLGTPEMLKMLTLLTFADISSVNPDAMTDWKAETLWHLYASTANFLNRHVDEERLDGTLRGESRRKFEALPAPLLKEVEPFLEGLPQRYLRIYSPEQVVQHFELSSRLWQDEIQLTLVVNRDLYEFTIVTLDKPGLFATLAGALSAWGMEIVKANAFSNSKGVVVDAFYFKDRFRTLDLNPSEHDRLKRSVAEIIRGQRSLEQLIRSRHGSRKPQAFKVRVETKVILDDESSAQSTVLEVIAQDRPGLLHAIAQVLAEYQCNIEIALIDTEGEMALDVFYLTSGGRKVPSILQTSIRDALFERLNADAQQTA